MLRTSLVALLLIMAASTTFGAAVVVIHTDTGEQTISVERIRSILLGRITNWASGQHVQIIISLEDSADNSMRLLLDRDNDRLLRGWKRLVYAGAGAMPRVVRSNAEALALVGRLPGAMAILPSATACNTTRVIPLDTDTP